MKPLFYPDNKLPVVSPESVGIPSQAVERFMDAITQRSVSLHSFMLLRHGRIAAQCYYAPYTHDRRHRIYSMSKSFTSAAVGIAIGEGLLSLKDRPAEMFQEELDGPAHPFTQRMTLEDLLTMSTVHKGSTDTSKGRWVHSFLNTPPSHPSGTTFAYDTTGTHMACAMVQKVTGQTVEEYLRTRLLDPIGIGPIFWEQCERGICMGGSGIWCTTEDMARFGQLYLQDGIWNDRQILPAGWAQQSLSHHTDNSCGHFAFDGNHGYGYYFWRTRHNGSCAFGMGGQLTIILPEEELVLSCTANTLEYKDGQQLILDSFWESIYPALQPQPLAQNLQGFAHLQDRCAKAVTHLPGLAHSPWEDAVNGCDIQLDTGFEGITQLSFAFAGERGTLKLWRWGKELEIPFGMGHYLPLIDPFTGLDGFAAASFPTPQLMVIRVELPDHVQRHEFHCFFAKDRITVQLKTVGGLRNGVERLNGYLGALL